MRWVDLFGKWAKRIPPPKGPLPNGRMQDALKAEGAALIIIDTNGYVWEVKDAHVTNGKLYLINSPRKAVATLFDQCNVPLDEEQPPNVVED